jgi:hypothetical protein
MDTPSVFVLDLVCVGQFPRIGGTPIAEGRKEFHRRANYQIIAYIVPTAEEAGIAL